MPHTGATGPRRSNRGRVSFPPAAGPRRTSGPGGPPPRIAAFDPTGEIRVGDNRAAARAALAESFAAQFGVDEAGPSADTLADRFGFRYEPSVVDPGLSTGRRTVTISGRGASRAVAPAERTIAARPGRGGRGGTARRSAGHPVAPAVRADRIVLIAVGLGLLLAFLAATSAHAATWVGVAAMR